MRRNVLLITPLDPQHQSASRSTVHQSAPEPEKSQDFGWKGQQRQSLKAAAKQQISPPESNCATGNTARQGRSSAPMATRLQLCGDLRRRLSRSRKLGLVSPPSLRLSTNSIKGKAKFTPAVPTSRSPEPTRHQRNPFLQSTEHSLQHRSSQHRPARAAPKQQTTRRQPPDSLTYNKITGAGETKLLLEWDRAVEEGGENPGIRIADLKEAGGGGIKGDWDTHHRWREGGRNGRRFQAVEFPRPVRWFFYAHASLPCCRSRIPSAPQNLSPFSSFIMGR